MALGSMMFSIPAAACMSIYVSVMNDLGLGQAVALYAIAGVFFLLTATLASGLPRH